jgi:hypothetical protein
MKRRDLWEARFGDGELAAKAKKPLKYRNRPCIYDGIKFQSEHERDRWIELNLMLKAGQINKLRRQTRFELIPTVYYVSDFDYIDVVSGEYVVEDAKSEPTKTPVYRLKKKLMAHLRNITIREI